MELSSFPAIDASPVSRRPSSFVSGPHVEKLPVELLIEIFALCAAEDSDAPLTLGTVCSTWNEIVNGSPRVWQVVILDDSEKSFATSQSRAKIWISRSAPLQFDLKLNVEDANNVLYPLAPFLPVLDRWRQITITGAYQKFACLSDTSSRRGMLNNLSTSINDDAANNYVFPRLTWIHSPSQSSRWEDYPHINICLTHSPRASLSPLVPLRYTSLSITDKTFQRHIQPLNSTAILSLLRTCSHLESFTFYGCMHSRISQSFPGVSLPRLHTLNIDESPDARVMLSKLYAPALSELCLIDLDIHYISDSLRESGDSEDDDTDS